MRDSSTEERLGPPQQPVPVFDLLRALVIAALGGYLIYTANRPMKLPIGPAFRLIWGGLMLLYGLFRLFRALPFNLRKSRPTDDDFS